jgi:hypothetical protein
VSFHLITTKRVIHTLKENVSLFSRFWQWNVISTAILDEEVSSACTVIVLRRACPEPLRRFNVRLWLNFVTICKKSKSVQANIKRMHPCLSLLYLHLFRKNIYCNQIMLDHETDVPQPRINCSMLLLRNLAEPSSASA